MKHDHDTYAGEDIVRVFRMLEYVGPRSWVEKTLNTGGVPANGTSPWCNRPNQHITSVLLGTFPEIIERVTA